MSARTPLFAAFRRALAVARLARTPGAPPADELLALLQASAMDRRTFLRGATGWGAAALLSACAPAGMSPVLAPVPSGGPGTPPPTPQPTPGGPRVAIVGAGMAGLAAAHALAKAGVAATLFEGADRTGGRMYTAKGLFGHDLTTELGGEFIDTGHATMLALAEEFGLATLDARAGVAGLEREAYFFGGRHRSDADLVRAMEDLLPRLAEDQGRIPEAFGYAEPGDWTKLDARPLDAYLGDLGASGWVRDFLAVAYETEYGLPVAEQSALNLAWLVGTELVDDRFEVFGESDERFKIQGGNQRLVDALAARYQGQVKLGHRLEAIAPAGSGYRLSFAQANGPAVEVEAEHVILTLPFTLLRDVDVRVDLPAAKKRAIAELGYGTNAKLMLGFKSRVWAANGYLGNFFTDDPLLQSGWDCSLLQPGEAAGLTIYTGGAQGLALGQGTPASQADARLASLEKLFRGARAAYTGQAERFHWPTHPWTKGSYAAYKPGQYAAFRGAEGEAVGNLRFAGEHTSADYQGYMEGAAETGQRAAGEVLAALGKATPSPAPARQRRVLVGAR